MILFSPFIVLSILFLQFVMFIVLEHQTMHTFCVIISSYITVNRSHLHSCFTAVFLCNSDMYLVPLKFFYQRQTAKTSLLSTFLFYFNILIYDHKFFIERKYRSLIHRNIRHASYTWLFRYFRSGVWN